MKKLDAITAGHVAHAGVARPRAAADLFAGRGLGMYPCAWRLRARVVATIPSTVNFDAISHKAWRPSEPSP